MNEFSQRRPTTRADMLQDTRSPRRELKLPSQYNAEFTRQLLGALMIRLTAGQETGTALPLHERLAWLDIIKVIDERAIGDAAPLLDELTERLSADSTLQSRLELGFSRMAEQ